MGSAAGRMVRNMSESLVEIGIEGGIHIARVTSSNLDTLRGAELTDQLKVLVPRLASGPLILDLSAVRFMQTQGLRAALLLFKSVKAAGGRVCICVCDESVRGMFAVTKLDSIVEIHDDMESAMRAMSADG